MPGTRRFAFRLIALLVCVALLTDEVAQARSGRLPSAGSGHVSAQHVAAASWYRAARAQWLGDGAVVSGAAQNTALYLAVVDLRRGREKLGGSSRYTAAIRAIADFEGIPITGVTSAMEAQVKADIAVVDRFFGLARTPWVHGCLAHGPGIRGAAEAWASEPKGTSHGVRSGPLKAAAEMLSQGLSTDYGDRSCYPAAIADLIGLESATRSQVSASSKPWSLDSYSAVQVIGAQIDYLDALFGPLGARPVLTSGA
jgi:hypothetical protein